MATYVETHPWESLVDKYYSNPEFKAYQQQIKEIIHASDPERGITLGELYRKLGKNIRREWTLDAIEGIDSIEEVFSYRMAWRRRK